MSSKVSKTKGFFTAAVTRSGTVKPLRPHRNGQWYVPLRINGKRVNRYFGKIADDPDKAKAMPQYLAYLNQLSNGEQPMEGRTAADVTVLELVDRFIIHQEHRYHAGDIGSRQFEDQRNWARLLLEWAGPDIVVDELTDLMGFRSYLSRRFCATSFNNRVSVIRTMLRWGRKRQNPLLTRPLDEDPALARKPAKLVKRERRERDERNGLPEYSPAECRALLVQAELTGRHALVTAMLLAMNGGMHAQHISDLPRRVVDLKQGRIDWVRTKSEEVFQVPLWPITLAAVERSISSCPRPAAPEFADRVMLKETGLPWVIESVKKRRDGTVGNICIDDELGDRFAVLERRLASIATANQPEAKRVTMKRRGRALYGFRRTFDKLADAVLDPNARLRIMGQSFKGHDPSYIRGNLTWDRLTAVTDHVHREIFGCEPGELVILEADHLVERFGKPVLMPYGKGGGKGKPKRGLSELNRKRWQDPAWREAFAAKMRANAQARREAKQQAR